VAYYGWRPYVPVAKRRDKAAREMKRLQSAGGTVQPVHITGRSIASTFWGKAWCTHLEGYSDFENRLPRGRTYVRNGSVCHLEIRTGEIRAKVSGSEMYDVHIGITPLARPAWSRIKKQCTGRIASLLDLLSGHISDGVMEVVTDRKNGLFPSPREIDMSCSCPDWAVMCKHVAAVLYGVGARLDEKPDLLFLLRGVDHEELIAEKTEAAVEIALSKGTRRRLAEADLAEVFGVEMDLPAARSPGERRAAKARCAAASRSTPFPTRLTAKVIRDVRERMGLTAKAFAERLGVSVAIVSKWESSRGVLNPQARTRKALEREWKRLGRVAPTV
jgi:uncharacterized Zn finger protein